MHSLEKRGLNPQQIEAAQHMYGPLLVIAGAGSGKTRVVVHRIAYLIEKGIPPSSILAVTFTNKAAEEMSRRIDQLQNKGEVLTCTFHSLGAKILRESAPLVDLPYDFTIYDEEDSYKLVKECLKALGEKEEKGLIKTLRAKISSAKNHLFPPEEVENLQTHNVEEKLFAKVYPLYQDHLKKCGAVDFDDLLCKPVAILQKQPALYQERWPFVLIDEYQDTNFAQYTLAKLLVQKHQNIFAVGDPDQSIYSWRGAQYQNILRFDQDFPGAKTIVFAQNYRSTNQILSASNALISHNESRHQKNLWSELGDGDKISIQLLPSERGEADYIVQQIQKRQRENHLSLSDMVIFYRTNAQSRTFEDLLLMKKIPYVIIGGLSFYQRKEIKDILSILRMVHSGTDILAFSRTMTLGKTGIGPATLKKILDHATAKNLSILDAINDSSISLSSKQTQTLKDYRNNILALREFSLTHSLPELLNKAIFLFSYLEYLRQDPETYQDRKQNVEELVGKAEEWEESQEKPSLVRFLEELSLKTNPEQTENGPAVRLMTLHNGKGLEFSCVFVAGLEEDLLPHINSKQDPESLEEERRLLYVGMTRAKRYLYLTLAFSRFLWGSSKMMKPSRFLQEIPEEFTTHNLPISPFDQQREESTSSDLLSPVESVEPSTPSKGPYKIGAQVLHKQFGSGKIQKIYETSYGLTYDVYFFEENTTRSLIAKYAKLEPIRR